MVLTVESVAALEEMTEAELLQLLLELESGDQDSQTNTVDQLLAGNSSVPKVKDLHWASLLFSSLKCKIATYTNECSGLG